MIYLCTNSLRARYIRNALVGMADFSWQCSHYIRISVVYSLRLSLGSAVGVR